MCSSGDSTLKASEASSAVFQSTLQNSFNTAFGSNQIILNGLTKTLTDAVNNPKGFNPATLAAMRTGANDTVSRQTTGAQVAAGNYGASHGGADLGSGVQSQIEGSIAGTGAQENANEQSNITIANGQLQNQNYWNAIQGLTGVANAENPNAYASNANSAGSTTANLGSSFLASKQADWGNTFGVIKGVSGLVSAAAGLPMFGGSGGGAKPGDFPDTPTSMT
jgi:hypothetical protein